MKRRVPLTSRAVCLVRGNNVGVVSTKVGVAKNSRALRAVYDPPTCCPGSAPGNMTVIAEKMEEAGYQTHQVGKRDAGMATPTHIPTERGFDSLLCYFHHDNHFSMKQLVNAENIV